MNVEEASSSSGSSFPRKREPSGLVFRSTPGSAESHWVDQPFGLLRSASAFAGMTAVGWLARACSGQPGFGADRKGVVEGKSVSVRVDLGGRRFIKKKNKK